MQLCHLAFYLFFYYYGLSCSSTLHSGEIWVWYLLIVWEKQQVKDLQSSQLMQPEKKIDFLKTSALVELLSRFSPLTISTLFYLLLLTVCFGCGQLSVSCNVLRRTGREQGRNPHSRCGTGSFSGNAEVSFLLHQNSSSFTSNTLCEVELHRLDAAARPSRQMKCVSLNSCHSVALSAFHVKSLYITLDILEVALPFFLQFILCHI